MTFYLKNNKVYKIRITGKTFTWQSKNQLWQMLNITPGNDIEITTDSMEAFRCKNPTADIKDLWVMFANSSNNVNSFIVEFVV